MSVAMGTKFSQGRILAFFMIYSCGIFAQQLVTGAEVLDEPVVPVKKYTIDLDQSPSERWIPLLKDFKSSAPLIVDYFGDQVRFMEEKAEKNLTVQLKNFRQQYCS